MSLRIGCDLDGTLADMDGALQREAERLFGPDVTLHGSVGLEPVGGGAEDDDQAPRRGRGLTERQIRELWAHVGGIENFWTTLPELEPGSVARLAELAARHRWEVLFLTQRPETAGDTAQVQSQRWLAARGFALPSVFVTGGSRGKVAAALSLDAVVDDRVGNCADVARQSKAMPILVWRRSSETPPVGEGRVRLEQVSTFAEALVRLEALAAPPATLRGLMGKVRRTLGV